MKSGRARKGRRAFLREALHSSGGLALAGLAVRPTFAQAPAIVTPESARPQVPHGTSVGDVLADRAVVWSRTDRPSRMVVEYATTESFRDVRRVVGPAALETSGLTSRIDLVGLPPGQHIFYRVLFQNLSDLRSWSLPSTGTFLSAPVARRDVSFAWSGDTCGQGWGINPEWGGLRLYETMRRAQPDFYIDVGDHIYADQPIKPEVTLDDGSVWKNVVSEAKSKVAETLDDFRGNYLYNLSDENLRRFNAVVPHVALWDDHEVRDNWYPTQILKDQRYSERSVALLSARAKRAFFEHLPIRFNPDDPERVYRSLAYGPALEVFAIDMRSYRAANSPNKQATAGEETALLGAAQVAWLKERLSRSQATWKVIASDMPIGLVVRDGPQDAEAVSNADDGPPLGRELEMADLLKFMRDRRVRNVIWITADVHYCAAHYYDPSKARFTEFHPFWEFVAGPAHAGTFGPNALDATFGPQVKFVGIPPGMKPNRPPNAGFQFFGMVRIDGKTEVMNVRLHNLAGDAIFSLDLPPER